MRRKVKFNSKGDQKTNSTSPILFTDDISEILYQCEYHAYEQVIDENYYSGNIDTLPNNPLRIQVKYYDKNKSERTDLNHALVLVRKEIYQDDTNNIGSHYHLNRYYDPFIWLYIIQDLMGIIKGLLVYQYCQNSVNWKNIKFI